MHDGEYPFVAERVWGTIVQADLRAWTTILDELPRGGTTRFLAEAREIDSPVEALRIFLGSGVRSSVPPGLRQAMVVDRAGRNAAQVLRDTSELTGAFSAVFADRDEALAWPLTDETD